MKYLVCGNYGVENVGDECIAKGIENLLKFKDSEASVVLMGKGNLLPFGIRTFIKSIFNPSRWIHPISLIRACDHFILGGGGLFTDEERPLTGFFWAMQGVVASILIKKQVTVLGVSCGSMGIISRLFTRILFKRAKNVYCRDDHSVAIAKKLGAKNAVLCPDMAVYFFTSNAHIDAKKNSSEKVAVFILRDYKNICNNTITNFVRMIGYIYSKYGFRTMLLDFQNDSKRTDGLLSKIIVQNSNKNIISIHQILRNLNGLSSVLRNAEFVVSMRYHGGLISLIENIPFISINYMQKSSNFWRRFDGIVTVSLDEFSKSTFSLESMLSCCVDSEYRKLVERYSNEYQSFAESFKSNDLLA